MANSAITTNPYQAKSSDVQNSDGSSLATKVVTGMVVTDSPLMFRNRIINGDMRIDQRNAGTTITPSSPQYLTDRFLFRATQISKFSAAQVGTSGAALQSGFTKALYLKCISAHTTPFPASDRFTIQQYIEGFNVSDLQWGTSAAKSVTLSFWTRSTVTGTHGGAIRNEVTATRSYPFTYTIDAANTWEYKTVLIPGDTTGTWAIESGVGISVVWSLGVGSTLSSTANAWAAGDFYSATGAVTSVATTVNAELYITGVQLEAGPVATPFERRPYSVELSMCQRYYEKSYDLTVAPANNALVDSRQGLMTILNNSEGMSCHIPFKVTKRIGIPVVTTYKSSGPSGGVSGNWHYYTGAGWVAFTVGSNVSQNYWMASATGLSGVTNGQSFILSGGWSADAEL